MHLHPQVCPFFREMLFQEEKAFPWGLLTGCVNQMSLCDLIALHRLDIQRCCVLTDACAVSKKYNPKYVVTNMKCCPQVEGFLV